ncbi:hypothetical protein [Streptomyces montanisoli]|uniref:Integral membrane protein n=1 Tax=Streptomyces montanisoli TaxID=2798581 RepID=A0A940MEU5_9ACTN|nr:hypothetical protein [Streptomyces montanisoli]MBP0458307.1 hypothetical protein [Streptomyces montanisoli]
MALTEGAIDEDSLYVLTAVLLTPAQFPAVLGDDFPQACAALGLPPDENGYGLVLGQDGAGARWTVAVDDVSLVAVAIAAWDCGMEQELSPPDRSVVAALPGWPLALAVAAPGVPEPHDPEGQAEPLAPPETGVWGPAQRRLGADEVATQWTVWRARFDAPAPDAGPQPEGEGGRASAEPHPEVEVEANGAADGVTAEGGARPESPDPEVHDVLAELHGYLEQPPPTGRVRSSFAPGGARILRADGPGWSFVARTDDMAFVLLDEAPGTVIPVGRGPELPGLLTALDAMAVRPA